MADLKLSQMNEVLFDELLDTDEVYVGTPLNDERRLTIGELLGRRGPTALTDGADTVIARVPVGSAMTSVSWVATLYNATEARQFRVDATRVGTTINFTVHGLGPSGDEEFGVAIDGTDLTLTVDPNDSDWNAITTRLALHRA